jgi:hypothetical protein
MDSFGEAAAAVYDEALRGTEESTVSLLHELARGRPALELAIGTGRIALPLAARGTPVDGIDLSPAMVAKLRSKPGGEALAVSMGDFADVGIEGTYGLIYIVFNTLFNLLSQEEQVRCFENVAVHLDADGLFVVEAQVPTYLSDLRGHQHVNAEAVEVTRVVLDVGHHDPVTQHHYENHVVLTPEGLRFYPVVQRYAWPSELDLMARIAGLRLVDRWGGWEREPFTAQSTNHISVYGR